MATQDWQDLIQSHLDLALATSRHCPAGERLTVEKLNKIMETCRDIRSTILFLGELQGFKTQPQENK
jgi:hypothetical protein